MRTYLEKLFFRQFGSYRTFKKREFLDLYDPNGANCCELYTRHLFYLATAPLAELFVFYNAHTKSATARINWCKQKVEEQNQPYENAGYKSAHKPRVSKDDDLSNSDSDDNRNGSLPSESEDPATGSGEESDDNQDEDADDNHNEDADDIHDGDAGDNHDENADDNHDEDADDDEDVVSGEVDNANYTARKHNEDAVSSAEVAIAADQVNDSQAVGRIQTQPPPEKRLDMQPHTSSLGKRPMERSNKSLLPNAIIISTSVRSPSKRIRANEHAKTRSSVHEYDHTDYRHNLNSATYPEEEIEFQTVYTNPPGNINSKTKPLTSTGSWKIRLLVNFRGVPVTSSIILSASPSKAVNVVLLEMFNVEWTGRIPEQRYKLERKILRLLTHFYDQSIDLRICDHLLYGGAEVSAKRLVECLQLERKNRFVAGEYILRMHNVFSYKKM